MKKCAWDKRVVFWCTKPLSISAALHPLHGGTSCCPAEKDNTQFMASATLLALLCSKYGYVLVCKKELCAACITIATEEAKVIAKPGRLHVLKNVGLSRLGDGHVVLQLKRHCVVHDGLEEEDEPGVVHEYGRNDLLWHLSKIILRTAPTTFYAPFWCG